MSSSGKSEKSRLHLPEKQLRWDWLPTFLRRKTVISAEPGTKLFRQVRIRLTLWYGGVLVIALLLFGLVLYLTVQQTLLQPVTESLNGQAEFLRIQWQRSSSGTCPLLQTRSGFPGPELPPQGGGPRNQLPNYLACFDPDGKFITLVEGNNNTTVMSSFYLEGTLVQTALDKGRATDIISGPENVGALHRLALRVSSRDGTQLLGVIVVSRSVEDLNTALNVLRNLLLILGAITLLGATLGGLFLADRALVPTRQAFARQQTFIADASHELRTPLTLLRADAEVLLSSKNRLDEDDAELLEDIIAETAHMSSITNDLLTLARLDAKSEHMEQEVVDLNEVADRVMRRMKALADEKGVSIHFEEGPTALVIGDRQLIEQATLILLDNAVKYNKPGGQVTVGTIQDEDQILLLVKDNGIGIPAEHLPHLGERFYRVDKARSRAAGGSGLGLSLARSIAGAHGGTLKLESIFGNGTTATLSLPLARSLKPMSE